MKSHIWSLNIMPVERDITPEPKLWEYKKDPDNKIEKNSRATELHKNRLKNIVIKMEGHISEKKNKKHRA